MHRCRAQRAFLSCPDRPPQTRAARGPPPRAGMAESFAGSSG